MTTTLLSDAGFSVFAQSGLTVLTSNIDKLLEGFGKTLALSALAGIIALVVGTILAAFRVSPVPALRAVGTAYITIFRNTPLVLLFVVFTYGLPGLLGIKGDHTFGFAVGALATYTSAFVCEAVRSGINSVNPGQAEAARSIGLTFNQNLKLVILPQAMRAVIPPLTSVLIALVKNSAVAEAFLIAEASFVMKGLIRDEPQALYWVFFGTALGYIIIVFAISGISRVFERKLEVAR
ncbi:amino acid ABC transporter permease [Cumulibacter manganitolerans]|uniref:amino acid ABC transporter permease n=1 Tax=Cumulibacter manganitolerans TaxID=1884992 RepID=UPI001E424D89|nr:amino acid ABC transporter permease [Cumulibacter manganitolerans]